MEILATSKGYDVLHYHPGLMPGVVSLLKYLWGDDYNGNLSYFKWKYDDNPFSASPLGMVVLYKGEVVGFRGYFETRWQRHGLSDEIIVLCPGDTCVHPDHRMKGLSVIMGNTAKKEYAKKYKLFFNFSSTKKSLPGYQKMGFFPLVKKTYLTRYSLPGLARFIMQEKKIMSPGPRKITFGKFDDILVSDRPRPEDMSTVITRSQAKDKEKISLFQDEAFFRWRFANKRNRYVFYYHIKDNIATGYVVTGMLPGSQRGYILDYAENERGSLQKIFQYIINTKHFDILSTYNFSLNDELSATLNGLGFRTSGILQKIEKYLSGECPLFVRPIKNEFVEEDWFIEGLDVRDIDNWEIKGICSDYL